MEIVVIISSLLLVSNIIWNYFLRQQNRETSKLAILCIEKTSELEKLSKELESQDSKISSKITEFNLIKRINDDTFTKQMDEMYLGATELKRFTEDTINMLDPIMNKNTIKNLNENLNKINTYLNSLQKQAPRNLNDVTYKSLSVKYNFSNN